MPARVMPRMMPMMMMMMMMMMMIMSMMMMMMPMMMPMMMMPMPPISQKLSRLTHVLSSLDLVQKMVWCGRRCEAQR